MGRKSRKEKIDPRESKERAWKIATNPRDFSKSERQLLIERGISNFVGSDGVNQEALLQELDSFICNALDRKMKNEILNNPPGIIQHPGKLALFMSLGSTVIKRHPMFINDPRRPKVHEIIHEYYINIIYAAARHTECGKTIKIGLGELVYGRDNEDEYGPPTGSVVEDIIHIKELDGLYYQVPLVHANRKCEARVGNTTDGSIQSLIRGKYVYIPYDDVHEKYEEYFDGRRNIPYTLEQVIEKQIEDEMIKQYRKNISQTNEKLEKLADMGQDDMLFKSSRYPIKLKTILECVDGVDNDVARLGENLTARDILSAMQQFAEQTEKNWIKKQVNKMNSQKSIGHQLSKFGRDDDTPHVSVIETREGDPNEYILEYQYGDYKQINVSEIADILEFPCMENLHESLLQSKPVRWELYTFVRYLLELDEIDVTVGDIKEWFSQYDWYREDVTEYQVEYEKRQTMKSGERPFPISCNNDNRNWAEHCIGMENCEYSLYRSVDLKRDVYDKLD